MQQIKVEFLNSMGSDIDVANAARVSFAKETTEFGDSDGRLLHYLAKHGHWSPFTHCVAKFRIKAPIFVARQLAKHQVGLSWNEVSRRYVYEVPEFYMPDEYRKRADHVKQGSSDETTEWGIAQYKLLIKQIKSYYLDMLDRGICPEQARMILPQSMMTEWIWTGSLYAWARVYNQRTDEHAQREAKQVALLIGEHMEELFPHSWKVLTNVL